MSIFSKLLKKKFGLPEVDVNKLPLGSLLVEELQKAGTREVFNKLSDEDMKVLDRAVQIELYNRRNKLEDGNAGIGKGY